MSRVGLLAGTAIVAMLACIAYLVGRIEPSANDASEEMLVSASVAATTKAVKLAAPSQPVDAIAPETTAQVVTSAWGEIEDPDHDCHLTEKDDKFTIQIPATLHDLAAEYRMRNAPRVMREVSGNFWAEVKVNGDLRVRGVTNSSMYAAYHGCGLLVWIDSGNYVRLERGNVNRHPRFDPLMSHSYVTLELRENGKKASNPMMTLLDQSGAQILDPRTDEPGSYDGTDRPTYLRLIRRGDEISASTSQDGVKYEEFKTLKWKMPAKVRVGIVGVSSAADKFQCTFENLKINPIQ